MEIRPTGTPLSRSALPGRSEEATRTGASEATPSTGVRRSREQLANGLAVRVAEVHDLPYVVAELVLPTGSAGEDAGRAGLAALTASLLDMGAGSRDASQIAEELDSRGAALSIEPGRDAVHLELRVLKRDLEWGLGLLGDLVQRPAFDAEEFRKLQGRMLAAAEAGEQEPDTMVSRLFSQALMGDHPYGRPVSGSKETLKNLTLDQVQGFHRERYGPAGAVLSLAGDLTPAEASRAARRYFGAWTGGAPAAPPPSPAGPAGPVLRTASAPSEQACLRVGFPGISREDPDYYPLTVLNYVLGGSFRSRLNQNIRASKGLTYSVHSGFSPGKAAGPFQIGMQTRNEQANLALGEIFKEIARIREQPISAAELREARQALIGGYPLRVDTRPEMAAEGVDKEVYGLPEDLFEDFRRGISLVTADDVQRVASRLFQNEKMAVAVVGDLDRVKLKPLDELLPPPGSYKPAEIAAPQAPTPAPSRMYVARPEALVATATAAAAGAAAAAVPSPVSAAAGLAAAEDIPRLDGVTEKTLPNGLKVLLVENHKAPVATVQVWYKVGSRNERPGITGLSHFLEHMMFRGSPNYPDGKFDETLALHGAVNNAFTTEDFTAYYENMAAENVGVALDLEADRMRSIAFTHEHFMKERDVVTEERRLSTEDSPSGTLWEQFQANAYTAHPYQWPIVGWMSDVTQLTPSELMSHYRTFYAPNNATLVVAGDIRPEELMPQIEDLFSSIPAAPEIPGVRTVEPQQQGERRFVVRKPAGQGSLLAGYHVPSVASDDRHALQLISRILAGGPSARLPREVVDKEKALSAWAYYNPVKNDPGLFLLGVDFLPDADGAQAEQALLEQVRRLQDEPVRAEELEKVRRQWEAEFIMGQDDLEAQANLVGSHATVGDWRDLNEDVLAMRQVRPEDLQRVARQYLVADNRTVGTLLPTSGEG